MHDWGFWEWLTYAGIALAAVALAADQAIKGSPNLRKRLKGLLERPLWSYSPLGLIGLSAVLIVLQTLGIVGRHDTKTVGPEAAPAFVETVLRLQFFGDRRVPRDVGNQNVATWFAYYSQSVQVTPTDDKGNRLPGGFEVPPTWIILVVLERPSIYRQGIASFSNPELAPPIEVRQATTRSIVVTTGALLPAGVLEISTVK